MKTESEALTKKIEEMQAKLDEANRKMEQRQKEEVKVNTSSKGRGFQPDINNKERNLACQFLDDTLSGREFQKIDLKELTDLKKIGEGAAAVVY